MTVLITLLSVTVYSAVIYAAITLFRLIFKKHVSPVMMYAAWFILIARLVIPLTVDSGFSIITITSSPSVQSQNAANAPSNETGGNSAYLYDNGDPVSNNYPANNISDIDYTDQGITVKYTQQTRPVFTLGLPVVLIVLWILGMALMLAQTVIAATKLKRRFNRDSIPIPQEWLDIAKRVKDELKVRGSLRILMIKDFVSPALNASFFPTIMIPEKMASQDAEKIEFAIRHEMTHLKRKDHIVCLLLAALRIIYWFNPIVWLASKQIKTDMETACDCAAVKPMSREEMKRYAVTVLEMYAAEKVRFVLGMSLGSTRKTAERRVRGIFMRKRSSYKAKITAVILSVIILLACFTTACQPVEERTVIENPDGTTQTITETSGEPTQQASASSEPMVSDTITPPVPAVTTDPNDWRVKFAGKFSSDGQVHQDAHSYQSPNIYVNITKGEDNGVAYFVTDIFITDIKYFRTWYADNSSSRLFVVDALKQESGVVGINGDLYTMNGGLTIRNSQNVAYKKSSFDELVMYSDGTMKTIAAGYNPDEIKVQAPYQTWGLGPMLLDKDGQPMTDFNSPVTGPNNPRTAIGYYEPGHYCFVTVDGRQKGYSSGYSMAQLSQLMYKLQCKVAFSFDGGGSTQLAFIGKEYNKPCDNRRKASDIVYITDN
jgi:beta-lactamase regulating signal transducer with metallopeptidase domain